MIGVPPVSFRSLGANGRPGEHKRDGVRKKE
jgi:hypothetical protein